MGSTSLVGQLARQPNIVGVNKCDQLSSGQAYALVPTSADPSVLLESADVQARIADLSKDLGRFVLRPVVDDKQFKILKVLGQNGLNCSRQQLRPIVGRQDDGDYWSTAHGAEVSA